MSYGVITDVNTKSFLNQQNGYYQKEYDFNWKYQNTYNDKTGMAQVNLKISQIDSSYDYFGEITIQNSYGLFLKYKGPIFFKTDIFVLDYLVEKLK
ncbi:hypothetical protein FCR2A7T_25940 [Flavobacterium cauense R2A-7]|nr:hypothetical protein FCR2A7T_25940 [Flavobacterium cauense R2A-7]